MAGKLQEAKGRVEKAVGKVVHSTKLKQKGAVDIAAGQLKQAVSKAKREIVKDINQAAKAAKRAK